MKRYIILLPIFMGFGIFWFYQRPIFVDEKIALPEAVPYNNFVDEHKVSTTTQEDILIQEIATSTAEDTVIEIVQVEEPEEDTPIEVLDESIINTSINLDIPFTSQAPTANWDQPWQDACEEASVLMVDYYYQNKAMPNSNIVEATLFDMVAWQEDNWQVNENLSVEKLALYVKATFGYKTEIVDDLTVEKIKYYLDRGLPVVVPADGKKLANPYFSNGGPEYHMLLIKGYLSDKQKFITNDPGTSHGENFLYSYDNMMYSIADWDKKNSSATGPKRALILYKD